MPHVELRYSDDLELRPKELFSIIEKVINNMDSSAGACKSRAFRVAEYLHTHLYLKVSVLRKEHRDNVFMQKLLSALDDCVKSFLKHNSFYSIELVFSGEYYLTSKVECFKK